MFHHAPPAHDELPVSHLPVNSLPLRARLRQQDDGPRGDGDVRFAVVDEEAAERVEADRGTARAVDLDEAPIERVAPRELRPKRGEAFALETSERRAEGGEPRRGDAPAVAAA